MKEADHTNEREAHSRRSRSLPSSLALAAISAQCTAAGRSSSCRVSLLCGYEVVWGSVEHILGSVALRADSADSGREANEIERKTNYVINESCFLRTF